MKSECLTEENKSLGKGVPALGENKNLPWAPISRPSHPEGAVGEQNTPHPQVLKPGSDVRSNSMEIKICSSVDKFRKVAFKVGEKCSILIQL